MTIMGQREQNLRSWAKTLGKEPKAESLREAQRADRQEAERALVDRVSKEAQAMLDEQDQRSADASVSHRVAVGDELTAPDGTIWKRVR